MSNYKESVLRKLETASQERRKAIDTFFDESKSTEERLKAFKKCGTFVEEADVAKALRILKDKQRNEDSVRASAIHALVNYAAENEKFQDELIGYLSNPEESEDIKDAALSVLQSNMFSSASFSAKRPAFINSLRNLVQHNKSSGRGSVKERSAEFLALEKDEFIQRTLVEGLENPEKKIVEPEVAIQLLSYDLHSNLYPLLRNIVQNPPNQRAKKEALRNLASDSSSADLLLKTLNDKKEDKEIRHVCAVGLQSLQPERLQSSLKSILTDKDEDEDLKVALLNTLNYTTDTRSTDEDTEFQSKLDLTQKESKSEEMKETYRKYRQNKLKK
jgi:hypothetical protein